MNIDDLIEKLQEIRKTEGNIQVTCTHSLVEPPPTHQECARLSPGDIFETTVENLQVHDHPTIGKCVRVWI